MHESFWSVTIKSLLLVMVCTFVLSPFAAAEDEEWSITLVGAVNKTLTKFEFEQLSAVTQDSFTDEAGDVFSGVPLITIIGLIDDTDNDPAFSREVAQKGYQVVVVGGDGYSAEISSEKLSEETEIILCNLQNDEPFASWEAPPYPLKLFGTDITREQSVGNIAVIQVIGLSASESDDTASSGNAHSNPDQIYSGSIELTAGTIEVKAGSGKVYDVLEATPLGALAKASVDGGYSFEVADHSYEDREILLLDAIDSHRWEKDSSDLVVAVNGEVIEDWGTDSDKFYNGFPLKSGDVVSYLSGVPPVTLESGIVIIELSVL
jgi:hypothetical protein